MGNTTNRAVNGRADGNAAPKVTFSFGKNWDQFIHFHLDAEREAIATASLAKFLGRDDLSGSTFLDIGCGSGLFSLAAFRLGADRIVSVDVDPHSVKATLHLRESAGAPDRWSVMHGSILDRTFTARLDPANIVYAWGSLHHTGDMWNAIRNTSELLAPNGLLFLAIYNKVEGRGSSEYWLKMKQRYNRRSLAFKRLMEAKHLLRYQIVPDLIRLKNPVSTFRAYKTRGMSLVTDVRDWLGGYPYEAARADEVFRFCRQELGLTLVNLRSVNDLGCNEFLFRNNH
jgi:2-polyprenyl-6-hydroxyphenyl methylase/3-demethylubiquinone-9 3-methyltransferase